MKSFFLFFLLIAAGNSYAQFDTLPDSPLDTDMGEAAGDIDGTVNQLTPNTDYEQKQEEKRQEELLENRYDVPDEHEEKEFNQNGTKEP